MKYSCCVCDLDGTLLDSNHVISQQNKDALQMLVQSGMNLVLATGRTDLMIKQYVAELGVKLPVIACNGGLIRDQKTSEILYMKSIDTEIAKALLHYCSSKNYDHMVYTIDKVYYSPGNQRIQVYQKHNLTTQESFKVPIEEMDQSNTNVYSDSVLKVLITHVDTTIIEELEALFNKEDKLTIVSSAKRTIDIMASNTTKGGSLQYLAEKLDINLRQTIVFGDNFNDISMFTVCGFPVAVANAEDEVKRAAKLITLSNEESGVGYAIRQYFM